MYKCIQWTIKFCSVGHRARDCNVFRHRLKRISEFIMSTDKYRNFISEQRNTGYIRIPIA